MVSILNKPVPGATIDPGASDTNRGIINKPTSALVTVPNPCAVSGIQYGDDPGLPGIYRAVKSLQDSHNSVVGYLQANAGSGYPPVGPLIASSSQVSFGVKLSWQGEKSGASIASYQVWSANAGTTSGPTTPTFDTATRIVRIAANSTVNSTQSTNFSNLPANDVYTWFDMDWTSFQTNLANPARRAYWITSIDNRGNESAPVQASGSPLAVGGPPSNSVEIELGLKQGVDLNTVAKTTIFTAPASGFTNLVVTKVILLNASGNPTTNTVSFGANATPTDWLIATTLSATFGAGSSGLALFPASNVSFNTYGASAQFVINVTAGGAAITADVTAWGFYF